MTWFGNLPVGRKLLLGFGAVLALLGGVGAIAVVELWKVNEKSTEIADNWLPATRHVMALEKGLSDLRRWEFRHVLDVSAEGRAQTEQAIDGVLEQLVEDRRLYEGTIEEARAEERALFDAAVAGIDEYLGFHNRFMPLSRAMDLTAASELSIAVDAYLRGERALKELADYNVAMGQKASAAGDEIYTDALWYLGGGVLLAVLLGLTVAWAIARNITVPLRSAVAAMKRQSDGIVTDRLALDRRDELGEMAVAFDAFNEKLEKHLVRWLNELAEGDLDVDVPEQSGDDMIAPAVRRIRDSLRELTAQTGGLIEAAKEGRLDTRADASRVRGAYATIVGGVNATLDAVIAPVTEASEVLERVAARDLTARVEGDYRGDHAKIKEALNAAVEKLDEALQEVTQASGQLASASEEITASSQQLAEGTGEQASSLEEVTSSLQELSSMSRQNSASAGEASGIARESASSLDEASARMQRLSEAMESIKASSDSTARIVKTIDEIAFQTNLLALNAAVEAARAGDAGKGFAVVAEEVRNLAMRSAEAAKSTAELIEASVDKAENGVELNASVLESLESLARNTQRSNAVIAEIAAASEQQSQGVEEINSAVEQMNTVTQETAASSEEGASTAEELSAQAEQLRLLVGAFRLSTGGSRPRRTVGPGKPGQGAYAKVTGRRAHAENVATPGKSGTGAAPSRNRPRTLAKTREAEALIPFDDEVLTEF